MIDKQIEIFESGVTELIEKEELRSKLFAKNTLNIKAGFDATTPDLHLGHTVLLTKLRKLQDLGHKVTLLIGDFTAMIGDPSGRNKTRPMLNEEQVATNAATYTRQAMKILITSQTDIQFNSTWLNNLGASGVIKLASYKSIARMLERDDFAKRFSENQSIAIHEILYPLLQGYDSVALNSDVEIGGTDQKFNLLMGRELQRHYGQLPQCIITMPLLEGLDGVNKMSKSLNNYIALEDTPSVMFGKIMSISDVLMWRYYDLLSMCPAYEILKRKDAVINGANPRDFKIMLAKEIVARFCGDVNAELALKNFNNKLSQDMPKYDIYVTDMQCAGCAQVVVVNDTFKVINWPNILKDLGVCASTSEANRLFKQGAIYIYDGDISSVLTLDTQLFYKDHYTLRLGKHRFLQVSFIWR